MMSARRLPDGRIEVSGRGPLTPVQAKALMAQLGLALSEEGAAAQKLGDFVGDLFEKAKKVGLIRDRR